MDPHKEGDGSCKDEKCSISKITQPSKMGASPSENDSSTFKEEIDPNTEDTIFCKNDTHQYKEDKHPCKEHMEGTGPNKMDKNPCKEERDQYKEDADSCHEDIGHGREDKGQCKHLGRKYYNENINSCTEDTELCINHTDASKEDTVHCIKVPQMYMEATDVWDSHTRWCDDTKFKHMYDRRSKSVVCWCGDMFFL
jgi:hypothetical protein